jgi:outer membrane protein TolC
MPAADAYTLLEAEGLMLEKNYLYHSYLFRKDQVNNQLNATYTEFLPQLSVSHTSIRPYGVPKPETTGTTVFQAELNVAQAVNSPVDLKAIRLQGSIYTQKELATKNSLLALMRTTYYQLKMLEEQQAQREANLAWLRKIQANTASSRGEQGATARAQLAILRETEALESLYFQQERAGFTIKNLLRMEPTAELPLNNGLPTTFVFPFPFKMKFSPSSLELAQLSVAQSKNELLRVYTSQVPNFFGAYQVSSTQNPYTSEKEFLFGVTWKLQPRAFFDVFAQKAAILADENQFDDAKERIARAVDDVVTQLKILQVQMTRQQGIVETQDKIVRAAFSDFNRGASSVANFFEDIATLFQERDLMVRQRYNTVVAFANFSQLVENSDLFYNGLGITKK